MTERILRVGKPTPLLGVISEPAEFDSSRPAVLLLNSGITHHVGPCRLSVKIARRVAAHGLLAARFDFSGIGDSDPRRGSESFDQVAPRECAEVMDYLERTRGVKRFILYGLCSGSDASYFTALVDKRVEAIAQIDAFCYPTPRYYLEYYAPLLLRARRWKSFLERQVRNRFGSLVGTRRPGLDGIDPEYVALPTYTRVFPPRDEVAAGFRTLVARGVHVFVTFTGGEPGYRYLTQFRESFRDVPFGEHLRVAYYPDTNHIVTQPRRQEEIARDVADWIAVRGGALERAGASRAA